ncbi:MAG TPA: efflux RND transporter periplasmic adaptor subunit, partial [Patescibacteria group bacterium]|nr:efflux RND transporter periplasmic adaptor subunit [Patescibacteria group bacterium]
MPIKLDRKSIFKLIRRIVFNKKFAIALVLLVVIYTVGNRGARKEALIETQRAQVEDIKKIVTATGIIRSQSEANLKFQTSGKVAYISAKQGDYVKKGQLIAKLDTADLQKRLKADLNLYFKERLDFEDVKDSQPGGSASTELQRIAQRAQADLDNSVIDVELRDLVIKYSNLYSPIEGYITQNPQVLVGSNVLATETIAAVADLDNLEFIAEIDEVDIGQIKEGKTALISLDAFADHQTEANVKTISKKAIITSTQSTVFEVIFDLSKGQDFLLGM